MKRLLMIYALIAYTFLLRASAQKVDPTFLVETAYYNQRSDAYWLEASMKVIRPKWSRELLYEGWALGNDYGVMNIKGPVKDKGISFLRIKSEGWNWLPSIERVVKISPSQMSRSWMGSDFTNEDLLKEASIVHDYTHKLLGKEKVGGTVCYKIQAMPKEGAVVVWGKVILWIGVEDILELKTEYYDEIGRLINTLHQRDLQEMGGKKIATSLEMVPAKKSGYRSLITITSINFNAQHTEDFFSISNMKKLDN